MTWREERQLLSAFLRKRSAFPAPLDTAKRVAKKKRKQRSVEKVLRWQQRHPKTCARKMRAYRRRLKLRKMGIGGEARQEQDLESVG